MKRYMVIRENHNNKSFCGMQMQTFHSSCLCLYACNLCLSFRNTRLTFLSSTPSLVLSTLIHSFDIPCSHFLYQLFSLMDSKPPISRAKMISITKSAIKAMKVRAFELCQFTLTDFTLHEQMEQYFLASFLSSFTNMWSRLSRSLSKRCGETNQHQRFIQLFITWEEWIFMCCLLLSYLCSVSLSTR